MDFFICGICRLKFNNLESFCQHKKNSGSCSCEICGALFHSETEVQQHKDNVHLATSSSDALPEKLDHSRSDIRVTDSVMEPVQDVRTDMAMVNITGNSQLPVTTVSSDQLKNVTLLSCSDGNIQLLNNVKVITPEFCNQATVTLTSLPTENHDKILPVNSGVTGKACISSCDFLEVLWESDVPEPQNSVLQENISANGEIVSRPSSNDVDILCRATRPSKRFFRKTGGRPRNIVWQHYGQRKRSSSAPHHVAQCNYCGTVFNRGRVIILQKHLAFHCGKVPGGVKTKYLELMSNHNSTSEISGDYTASMLSPDSPCSSSSTMEYESETQTKKVKRSSYQPVDLHFKAMTVTKKLKDSLDKELLKFLVGCNLPFSIVENDFFISFVKKMRAGYNPASRTQLANKLLWEEADRIATSTSNELSQECNLTLAIDGWTDHVKSLYAFTVLTSDRKCYLHSLIGFSEEKHTADFLTYETRKVVEDIGSRKIAAFVTDNAANMKKLREDISNKYPHIFILQCMPHFINLITNDIMKHEWIQSLMNKCLTLVAYFCRHNQQKALLIKCREACDSKATELKTVAKTRWYSVAACLHSVLDNKEPLRKLMCDPGSDILLSIKSIINSKLFWADLENVSKLMDPLIKVVAKLEAKTATIADCLHQLVSLGGTIEDFKVGPENFQDHCKTVFAERWDELSDDIYLVSYFLHPTFRDRGLVTGVFPRILKCAGNLWKSCGHGKTSTLKLLHQLLKYKQGEVPYNIKLREDFLSPVLWWQATEDVLGEELKTLAIKLLSITPHAVACERIFSILSWIHNKYRNCLQVSRLEAMGKIYIYNSSHKNASVDTEHPCGKSTKQFIAEILAADESDDDGLDSSQQCEQAEQFDRHDSQRCEHEVEQYARFAEFHNEVWKTFKNTFDLHGAVFLKKEIVEEQCSIDVGVCEDKKSDSEFEIDDRTPGFVASSSSGNMTLLNLVS